MKIYREDRFFREIKLVCEQSRKNFFEKTLIDDKILNEAEGILSLSPFYNDPSLSEEDKLGMMFELASIPTS